MKRRGIITWLLLTAAGFGAVLVLRERVAYRRLETIRALAPRAAAGDIVAALGKPVGVKRPMGIPPSYRSFQGYRGPVDWSRCLDSKWPYLHLPVQTWILLQADGATEAVTGIWWENDRSWDRLLPLLDGPGEPPGVTRRR